MSASSNRSVLLVQTGSNNPQSFEHAKKVESDSLGLVDFAIGLENPVLNLPDGQVLCFEQFE